MTPKISIRRIVGAAIALGLIAGAVYFALESRRADRQFYEWVEARPVTVAVDLSRPGKVTAPLHQTCSAAHGEAFYLTVARAEEETRDDARLARGLVGTITIHDLAGKEVAVLGMGPDIETRHDAAAPLMIAYGHPFAQGEYTATIEVQEGAPGLAGIEQTVYAKYVLCGLERLGVQIAGFLAFVCGIPGLIVGVFVVRGFVKHGWSVPKTNACPHDESADSLGSPEEQ